MITISNWFPIGWIMAIAILLTPAIIWVTLAIITEEIKIRNPWKKRK